MFSRVASSTVRQLAPRSVVNMTVRNMAYKFDASIGLSEDQIMFQETAEAFSEKEFLPNASKWDDEGYFPKEVLVKAAELGFAGLYTKEDVGGQAMSRLDSSIIFEALATGCPSTAAFLTIHNMCSWMIDSFGSEELRQKYLPKMTTMESFASYCLTEPNAGSDAASLTTTAVLDGDHYVLNGSKAFISGGDTSDIYIVMARTGGPGAKGISAFIVEKDTPGFQAAAREHKMGWKNSPTAAIYFDNVRIPKSQLLGEEGKGFTYAMKGLDGGRINIASMSLGGAQTCLNLAFNYLATRKQFGKPLIEQQALQFKLADMSADLTAARLMVHHAAKLLDEKHPTATMHCAMAKKTATELCYKVCDEALQLHGGSGYLKDCLVEKYVRDLRVHRILEGTSEIMNVVTFREMFKSSQ